MDAFESNPNEVTHLTNQTKPFRLSVCLTNHLTNQPTDLITNYQPSHSNLMLSISLTWDYLETAATHSFI